MNTKDLITKLESNNMIYDITYRELDENRILLTTKISTGCMIDKHAFNTIKNYADVSAIKVLDNWLIVYVTIRD